MSFRQSKNERTKERKENIDRKKVNRLTRRRNRKIVQATH